MHRHDVRLPLIGVFPWGCTNGRDTLAAGRGSVANYPAHGIAASRQGAPLNQNHTHFVLVDNGKSGSEGWGSEISLRTGLEAACAHQKGIPVVQLVVNGGPGTLATVHSTVLAGQPVVVLVDSGGAATAIYDYFMDQESSLF